MKKTILRSIAGLAIACFAATASADTYLTSANFDLDGDATWSAGVPSEFGDPAGVITNDYNFDDLGSGNVNGNFDAGSLGTVSVTQTAGAGLGDQYNVYNNPNFTFNLNGGSITSDSGIFLVNGTTFNVGGGALTTMEYRLANSGAMTVSSGSFTASVISLRGGTFTQTGGTITSDSSGPVFNQGGGATILNLSGGSLIAGTGNNDALINNSTITATIDGSLTANLPGAVNLFSGGVHGNSSTINFTTNWTGSLTLDASTAWDDIFEAGNVYVDGVELGVGQFEAYFANGNGVITAVQNPMAALPQEVTAIAETALNITLSGIGGDLTFAIATGPNHGTLDTYSIPNVIYTPANGYEGPDSFTFTVSDGVTVSDPATVSITVLAAADVSISAVGDGAGYDVIGTEASSFYTTNVVKSFDVGTVDHKYGTDGYLIFGGASSTSTGEYGTPGTYVQSTPTFLDTLEADASITLIRNNTSQGPLDDPSAVTNGTDFVYAGYLLNNVNVGTERQMLTFSVTNSEAIRFRLGVLGGNEKNTGLDPEGVRLSFSDGVTTELVSSLEMLTGTDPAAGIGMLFFDVEIGEGVTGTFTLYGVNDVNPTIAGVTFDRNFTEVSDIPDFGGEVISGGTEIVLSWMTSWGTSYGLEATDDLMFGVWSPVVENIDGIDGLISVTNSIADDLQFFRPYVED
ncbi:Ig-like domain-containing protein [Pontiellaceae bacterium B1224]|nr:Ig-like domain-containing protein [Pontiellaceae bacterium B1224]